MQMLFPVVRFTDVSSQLAPFVVNMARAFDARVHVLRVEPPLDEYIEMRVKEAGEWLDRFVENYFADCPVERPEVVPGDPATEILSYAQCHDIDCIIIGTHGRKGMNRILFGSTAQTVVGKATVPVLSLNPHSMTREFKRKNAAYLGRLLKARKTIDK